MTFLSVCIKSLVKYYLKNVPHTPHLHNPFQLVHPKGRMELERMTPKTSQNILFVFGYRSRPWRIPDAFSPSFCIRSKFQSCRRVTGSAKSTAEPEKKRCLVSGAQPRLAGRCTQPKFTTFHQLSRHLAVQGLMPCNIFFFEGCFQFLCNFYPIRKVSINVSVNKL